MFQISVHDNEEQAKYIKSLLNISRNQARKHAENSIQIQNKQGYLYQGNWINLSEMKKFKMNKRSISPEDCLHISPPQVHHSLPKIHISNETTLMAAQKYHQAGKKCLVLNFANGLTPGGGFMTGSKAQEETLCFASTLFNTLVDDPMYDNHYNIPLAASSAHAILSTVSVFMNERYQLVEPWRMDVVTCAAPIHSARHCPKQIAAQLLHSRIYRIYQIAAANQYQYLVLGAWGCGAFNNSPETTANSFKTHLLESFQYYFKDITFAIADWSTDRRFINPFINTFSQ